MTDVGGKSAARAWPWNAIRFALWGAFAIGVAAPVAAYFAALAFDPVPAFSRAFPSLAESSRLALLLARTAAVAALAAAISAAAAAAFYAAGRSLSPRPRRALWALALLPFFVPGHFSAIAWIQAIGYAGWLNEALKPVGLGGEWLPAILYSSVGCAALMALHAFPVALAFLWVGERSLGASALESASLLMPPGRLWRAFLFGWMRPWLAAGALAVFIASLNDYSIPSLLRLHAYPVEIMTAYDVYYDRARAMSLAAPLALVSLAAAGALGLALARAPWPAASRAAAPLPSLPRRAKRAALLASFALLVLAAFFPLATLVKMAGAGSVYAATFATARAQILSSLAAAPLAAALAVALAVALAAMQSPSGAPAPRGFPAAARRALSAFMFALFALPGSLLAMAMIAFWNRPPGSPFAAPAHALYDSGAMLPIGLAAVALPVAYLAISARLRATPRVLADSERMLASAPLRRWLAATAPRLARPAALAALLAFVLAMQDLQASLLLAAPGQSTLSIRAATLLHYNPDSMVAAFCLIAVGVMALAAAAFAAAALAAASALRKLAPRYALD